MISNFFQINSDKLSAGVAIPDLRRLKLYNILNGNYASQIVAKRYFRVMILWTEGTNQVKIGHKIGYFK